MSFHFETMKGVLEFEQDLFEVGFLIILIL